MKTLVDILSLVLLVTIFSCETKSDKKDKIFHAGPNVSGFGTVFFSLYNGNTYQVCDGDFTDHGCYTGSYVQSGDTLELKEIRYSNNVSSNRFLVCRYDEQDSSYWKVKYSESTRNWKDLKQGDFNRGATGDVFELDANNQPKMNEKYFYIIRQDELKNR